MQILLENNWKFSELQSKNILNAERDALCDYILTEKHHKINQTVCHKVDMV